MALWGGCIPFGQFFVAFWLKMSYTKIAYCTAKRKPAQWALHNRVKMCLIRPMEV